MTEQINISEYPVFEKGIFKQYPALFDAYFRNTPDHQKKKYQKTKRTLPKYEETFKWQLIKGPGFSGATHPGTGKTFNGVMTAATHPVYNSDCLYINPSQNVFAISDPPGATTFSRTLITELDEYLQTEPVDELGSLINKVNKNAGMGLRDRATLALVHFPRSHSSTAQVLLSGDSYLFQANIPQRTLKRLDAVPNRWGTPNAHFELTQVDLTEGDIFILASDGISAVRPRDQDNGLDEVVLSHIHSDPENFVFNVAQNCNVIFEEKNGERVRTAFGGGDDVSIILVDPAKLQP
ncbi:MAG: SpoIIE family protein phosphatase, partial [Chloroflexi bacterium]|nr:SpoIIE family protein phosphatase [Chloroflexota bacterium]